MYARIMGKLNARRNNLLEEGEKGFTLIELLVVVIIIGILAAIAIPVYLGIQANAKDSSVQSDVTNAKTAVVALQTSGAPVTASTLDLSQTTGIGAAGFTQSGNLQYAITYTPASNNGVTTFCIVGTSVTGSEYYATDSSGAVKLASGSSLPTGCTTPTAAVSATIK